MYDTDKLLAELRRAAERAAFKVKAAHPAIDYHDTRDTIYDAIVSRLAKAYGFGPGLYEAIGPQPDGCKAEVDTGHGRGGA